MTKKQKEKLYKIVNTALLGKDSNPDYYDRGVSMVDPHLRDKSLVCFVPEQLEKIIDEFLMSAD